MVIAVDGTAGSGKSTLARQLAQALGYRYVDSGAMYRAVGWTALQRGVALNDEQTLTELASSINIRFEERGGEQRVLVDGEDVSERIRSPEASAASSAVAVFPGVRAAMVARQRRIGLGGGIVIEGRDIGTVVFPDADVKFYIDADLEIRAKRRSFQLEDGGMEVPLEVVIEEMRRRDMRDSSRADSPLKKADDAVSFDTSSGTIDELVEKMIEVVGR